MRTIRSSAESLLRSALTMGVDDSQPLAQGALPDDGALRVLRARFCAALHANDYTVLRSLAADLRDCTHTLPRSVCLALGLPRGSTYARAAATIVAS
jgi:hypothetical protein